MTLRQSASLCASMANRSVLSNGANDYFSDFEGGAKSPVDLPLRLDDAAASPTTPQGQHQ